ncbi:MAG: hypothetical protein M3Q55_08380 [Acidobacteriota bacterium]|nr:hypothetical protein [Acidobacteriota bacterium]
MRQIIDGLRRAFRAWPMALALVLVIAALSPALSWRDRLAAVDFGLGGFPFNISPRDYYDLLSPAQYATLGAFFVLWVFLSGGIIDRLARDARSSGTRFFGACGACFGPLLRLAALNLAMHWIVLTHVAPALAEIGAGAGETTHLALYGLLALLLFAISLIFDYARVRLVIEDRRSAVGALAASVRMLRANGGRMLGVQGAFWLLLVAWIAARGAASASTPAADSTIWATFLIVIAFASGELLLKLSLTAAQASLYQDALASAGWVARVDPAWPDEPSADPAAAPAHRAAI